MRRRFWLRAIPFGIIAGTLFLSWPLAGIDYALKQSSGKGIDKPLVGSSLQKEFPTWTWDATWSGLFQKQMEEWINYHVGLRGLWIRNANQVFYSVLKTSYMGNNNPILIGEDNNLLTLDYARAYCDSLRLPLNIKEGTRLFQDMKRVEDWLTKKGKIFIYVITPSKAAYFPESIPDSFGCHTSSQTRPAYWTRLAMAHKTGISMIDASELVISRKGKHHTELFPRTGIHYNQEATLLVVNALLKGLGDQQGANIVPLPCRVKYINSPIKSDRDIFNLLNISASPGNYEAPQLECDQRPAQPRLNLKMAMVGGSFLSQPAVLLGEQNQFKRIDLYNYFKIYKSTFPGPKMTKIDDRDNKVFDDIFNADVIVLEENESVNIPSGHGRAFLFEALRRIRAESGPASL